MANIRRISILLIAVFLFVLTWGTAIAQPGASKNYKQVVKDLEKLRGLKFKRPVSHSVKSRSFIKAFITKTFHEELPPRKLKAMDSSLKAFGFIPERFELMSFMVNLYTEQVAGLYDYKSKSMYLIDGSVDMKGMKDEIAAMKAMGVNLEDMLLIHELDHALQDQSFSLSTMIKNATNKNNDDYEIATQSVFEGDAYLVMLLYMFEKMGGAGVSDMLDLSQLRDMMGDSPLNASQDQFSKAPLFFKRTMLFPYMDGMVFIDQLRKRGGWALANKAFTNPPMSSEHILHVDNYLRRDIPIWITWKNLPSNISGWQNVDENVLGEIGIRTLFEQYLPSSDFKSIAEGWGGDKYRIYDSGSNHMLVWYTTWDRERDSKEFFKGYLSLLKAKYPRVQWIQKVPNSAYLGNTSYGHVYLGISGNDVLVMEKVPANQTKNIIKQAWGVSKTQMR